MQEKNKNGERSAILTNFIKSKIIGAMTPSAGKAFQTGTTLDEKIFGSIAVGSTTITADSNTDTLTFAAGSGVTITPDSSGKSLTISTNGYRLRK